MAEMNIETKKWLTSALNFYNNSRIFTVQKIIRKELYATGEQNSIELRHNSTIVV